ncbi:dolichyl glycosyltransferase, variant [Capsaspora owczarzaki ATCC 30864]|nr:dolichyl glycosyltransferase, variant [Capsaspora owczarzaki ATCC 30864]
MSSSSSRANSSAGAALTPSSLPSPSSPSFLPTPASSSSSSTSFSSTMTTTTTASNAAPLGDSASWAVLLVATLVKLLLLPAYRSTDFEVHRNWLAITHSLPLRQWYTEDTSQWTLDYPPFFAWFEWLMSQVAVLVDPAIVVVSNLEYASSATVTFQRLSVIVTDIVLFYGVQQYVNTFRGNKDLYKSFIVTIFIVLNAGLLLVDHIHFQYNGILNGVLLLSIAAIQKGHDLIGGLLFAVLLNLKHIYLYLAPAYFVFLLRHYCFAAASSGSGSDAASVQRSRFVIGNFLRLGAGVAAVFALSFGPFLLEGQLGQLLSRLFPFKRGLCHAYWAPNFWALYSALDKVLIYAGPRLGLWPMPEHVTASMTGGLVGDVSHVVLPTVPPVATMVLTLLFMLPILVVLWRRPTMPMFLRSVVVCAYASFLFGWHVHEKAIVMVVLPMSLIAVQHANDGKWFLLLSASGLYSLLPLIFEPREFFVKHLIVLSYVLLVYCALRVLFR